MEKLVLIDGNSLINRAFYAMPLLTTRGGIYTNAVYGFMNMFFRMLDDEKPSYVAVAFDLKAPTFRHKMYDAYKGTRKPMPDELRPQIPLLKEVLKVMNIHIVEKEGFEADDIIGTIAKSTDVKTVIITGDRDSFQLVDDSIDVYFTKRGITDIDIYNSENFKDKTSILPHQIIELKALMGDASDNIPGVKGIGEKTAINLICEYQNVENIYKNIDNLKGKVKENLTLFKDDCFLSKTLATIDTNVPIDLNLENMKISLPFSSQVKDKFFQLEFRSLVKRNDLFERDNSLEVEQLEPIENIDVVNINEDNLDKVKFFDCNYLISDDKSVQVFDGKNTVYNFNIRQTLLDDGLPLKKVIDIVSATFTKDKTLILFNNKDFRKSILSLFNMNISAHIEDVAILKYLTDFSGRDESFSEVSFSYGYDKLPPAFSLYKIYNTLKDKIKEWEIEDLYNNVEMPLSNVLFEMEKAGFKIDVKNLYSAGEKYLDILTKLENKIKEYANSDTLNINSPKQLGELLFEKLKIGKGKKTKTGYSTSAEILEEYENSHPIIPLILKYRQIQKLQSTYIEGFKRLLKDENNFIHTSFNQTVTATGRLSSKEPNLQNIPVRDDEGKELRKLFVSRFDNGMLVGADYSQIELRLLADFSNCKTLIDGFINEIDIHSITASNVFNVPLDKVNNDMRRDAKAVNFGIIYGMSEFGLAKSLKISNKRAKEYIDTYFSKYKEVKEYLNSLITFAKDNGYSKTLLGRRRYIGEINSTNYNLRLFGERVAMNMPLQGSSADIIKLAMIKVSDRLKKEKLESKLILQIHDELILDCPSNEVEIAKKILKEEMENAVKLKVPLTVSVECGKTWFDAK